MIRIEAETAVKLWLHKFNIFKGDKRWLEIVLPGLLLLVAAMISLQQPATLAHLQNLVWDNFQRAKPRIYQPVPVRIVDIDEQTLSRLGQWPWPRTEVARLVDRLKESGAATVVFDILFSEPDRISSESLKNFFGNKPENDALNNALSLLPDSDAILAASMAQIPSVAALALLEDGSIKASVP